MNIKTAAYNMTHMQNYMLYHSEILLIGSDATKNRQLSIFKPTDHSEHFAFFSFPRV